MTNNSGGQLAKVERFTTAFLEARLFWIREGGKPECIHDLQQLRNTWDLDSVNCILAVSDYTKLPYDSATSLKGEPVCTKDHDLTEEDERYNSSLGYEDGYGYSGGGSQQEPLSEDRHRESVVWEFWHTIVHPWERVLRHNQDTD